MAISHKKKLIDIISTRNTLFLFALLWLMLSTQVVGLIIKNDVLHLIWNLIFIFIILIISVFMRIIKDSRLVMGYFISFISAIYILLNYSILHGIYNYIGLLVVFCSLILYPFKKLRIIKVGLLSILTIFPLMLLLTYVFLDGKNLLDHEEIFNVKNDVTGNTLVLENHDQGALGGSYILYNEKILVKDFLMIKKRIVFDIKTRPNTIVWINKIDFSIDGVIYSLN